MGGVREIRRRDGVREIRREMRGVREIRRWVELGRSGGGGGWN